MIRYALICEQKHMFESLFASSAAFDKQRKRGLVSCPVCGSEEVEKAIMAPQIARKDRNARAVAMSESLSNEAADAPAADRTPVAMMSPREQEFRKKLKELREHVTKNADYVGPKFPEEARKMHYGDIEHRSIYGEASPQEATDLHEEGVEFHPLPILPDERN